MKEYLTGLGATEVITEEENSKRNIKSLYQVPTPTNVTCGHVSVILFLMIH